MKSDWQTKKLGDVLFIQNGYAFDSKGFSPDTGMPLIRIRDLKEGTKTETKYKGTYDVRYEVRKGDFLIGMDGEFGCYEWHGEKALLNQRVCRLQDFKGIDSRFLFYGINKYLKDIEDNTGFTTVKHISSRQIANIVFPFPDSVVEQKRIVKKLDEVFEKVTKAKENAEKNLHNSRDLFESYLQRVFANPGKGWQKKRLEEVCQISSKLIDPREKKYTDLIHVGAGNIVTKSGNLIDLKTAKEEKLISGKFLFDGNMVLYSKIRPYLMKVVRPDFVGLCSADIYPLLPEEGVLNRDFLFYLLLTSDFTKYAVLGSGRAGMPKVNREHLFAFTFFFPSLSEQKAIVKKLDALSIETKKLEQIYEQKLADLEELKKSVLSKAFNAEL